MDRLPRARVLQVVAEEPAGECVQPVLASHEAFGHRSGRHLRREVLLVQDRLECDRNCYR